MKKPRSQRSVAVNRFQFRKHDNIGVSDAEQDQTFLASCFVDTGELDALRDIENPRRIVLGRTGSGKTALLMQFQNSEPDRVITVQPESLSLNYISNSNILNFVQELGVNLDILFRLLWRHVFVVEILKALFKIQNENDSLNLSAKIANMFRDKKHARALEYLRTWGSSFWEDTDYRIKELTTKVESDLRASIGTGIPPAKMNLEGAQRITEEEKQQIVPRAQEIINRVQIKELSDILELLRDVLEKRGMQYYVTIDRLDENWIVEKLRYVMIRALIETVRDFRKAKHVKIIMALRYDLIDRVFRHTRDAGFQEDKYEGLYLNLQWSRQQLTEILDLRISHLVKQRHIKKVVTHADVLPRTIMKQPTIDYLLDRTLLRPRDIIEFFNFCILQSADNPKISSQMIKQAEGEYSRTRLRSIAQEWFSDYPNLFAFTELLKKRPHSFPLGAVSLDDCTEFCLNLLIGGVTQSDDLVAIASRFVDVDVDVEHFKRRVFQIYYRVGLVGLKLESYQSTSWTTDSRLNISVAEIAEDTKIAIHPCFYRFLERASRKTDGLECQ